MAMGISENGLPGFAQEEFAAQDVLFQKIFNLRGDTVFTFASFRQVPRHGGHGRVHEVFPFGYLVHKTYPDSFS